MKKILSIMLSLSMLFQLAVFSFASGSQSENGDIIQFGNYPQTLITDNNLVKTLDNVPKKWVSYDYYYHYLNDDNSIISGQTKITDNMQYADFSYEGSNYRAVNYIRPQSRASSEHWPNEELYPDLNLFNEIYYFKYEPISWVVVDAENGLVMSKNALDQQVIRNVCYYDSDSGNYYTDENMNTYANDYATSYLRSWLNNDFIATAFTEEQSGKIVADKYELDLYNIFTDGYYFVNSAVDDKISIPTTREFRMYNYTSTKLTDYAAVQGHGGLTVSTRTIYEGGFDDNACMEAVSVNTSDKHHHILDVGAVNCIVPIMKLSVLENNTLSKQFENGSSCNCICHKLQHNNSFFAKIIYKFIMTIYTWFNINDYCDCGLRHY